LQAPATYKSDSLWSYEIGTKNEFADGRLHLQASVFYIDWSNIQQSVSANGCFTTSYKDNLGRATIKGFDFAAQLRPIEHLLFELTGGYQDAKYATTAYTPPSSTGERAIIANEGDSLGVAPWNAGLSGEYDFPVMDKTTYFRVDYTYTAKRTDHAPFQDPVTTTYDPDLPADGAIRLLGARLGLRFDKFDVSLFGRNLLNDAPLLGVNHDGLGDPLFYELTVRPRTFGVTGTYRF
jgi:outer membrane receptor protein involved in Fe transport